MMSATAKLFMHGRSQAVRLPKEFRFDGTEVRAVRARGGAGALSGGISKGGVGVRGRTAGLHQYVAALQV
jgi:hypothetical protein